MTFIEQTQRIRKEGKIHWFLLIRLRILLVLSLLMSGMFAYNILYDRLQYGIGLFAAAFGFFVSTVLFSRMGAVNWNAEEKRIAYQAIDIPAVTLFGVYVAFEILVHSALKNMFPETASVVLLALMFGTMVGRTASLALKINSVYAESH